MAPQDDLTAEERADAIMQGFDISSPHMQRVIEQALQQTRQAALREYREAIAQKLHLDFAGFQVYSRREIIAVLDQIDIDMDRLASEGG